MAPCNPRRSPAQADALMFRLYTLLLFFHTLIGWRLLPDLPSGWEMAALIVWLAASTLLIPFSLTARRIKRQPLSDGLAWAGLIALGSFSSLLVLTVIRDVVLLAGAALGSLLHLGNSLQPLETYTAVAVPILAALLTLVGFVNARR